MKYFSKYDDETTEEAKKSCMHGKGFDSIEEAIEMTRAEAFGGPDEKKPFVVLDYHGDQVWPAKNSISIGQKVVFEDKAYEVLGYAARTDELGVPFLELAWTDYTVSPSGYLAVPEASIKLVKGQSQSSLYEQLKQVRYLANKNGYYDAADFITSHIENIEQNPKIHIELFCPNCKFQHIDRGIWATKEHKTHLCLRCKTEWRPFEYPTFGVK